MSLNFAQVRLFFSVFLISLMISVSESLFRNTYASECDGYDEDPIYSECDSVYCGEMECEDSYEEEPDE